MRNATSNSSCSYHAEGRRWCGCKRSVTLCLWRSYGEIVVWCCTTRKSEIEYESPVYSSALCNNICVQSGFSSILHWKTGIATVWTPRTVCVALSICAPRYEGIISVKSQQKSLSLFPMSSRVNTIGLSVFCWVVSMYYG